MGIASAQAVRLLETLTVAAAQEFG
jgi:hypothetical protein